MKGKGRPDNTSTCPVSTIHYLTGPSDPAFEERGADCGQEPPAPQNSKSQTTPSNDLPSRPDALPEQRPPCLPFPTFPRSSREGLSPQGQLPLAGPVFSWLLPWPPLHLISGSEVECPLACWPRPFSEKPSLSKGICEGLS